MRSVTKNSKTRQEPRKSEDGLIDSVVTNLVGCLILNLESDITHFESESNEDVLVCVRKGGSCL